MAFLVNSKMASMVMFLSESSIDLTLGHFSAIYFGYPFLTAQEYECDLQAHVSALVPLL